MATQTISQALYRCVRAFSSLAGELKASAKYREQVSAEQITEQLDRLKLWYA